MNVEDYKTMNVEQAKNSETAKFLLASVRITDNNLLTRLNDHFGLTREFYYGKILYTDKKKYTIRVIRDLDKTMKSQVNFTAYKKDVTVIDLGVMPIAEVDKDINGNDILTRNNIVKVPNYERAQEFIEMDGNTVRFMTDKRTVDTANIMDTLVVHGRESKFLFYPSSFLSKWWEKNKKDLMDEKIYMMEKAKQQAENAKLAEQKRREAKRKEEAKERREKKKEEREKAKAFYTENPRRSKRKKLHEEYTEKLKL